MKVEASPWPFSIANSRAPFSSRLKRSSPPGPVR